MHLHKVISRTKINELRIDRSSSSSSREESQKSNDTAKLSFSMNEEVSPVDNDDGEEVFDETGSPSRPNAQMPVVNNVQTKTISGMVVGQQVTRVSVGSATKPKGVGH